MSSQPVLSVDVGGARCKFGLVESDGTVDEYGELPTEEIRAGGPERLIEEIKPYRKQQSLSGFALAVPATVDWDHNHVRSSCPELPWIENSQNKKILQDELGLPLLLMNDVEATLVGEWRWGELKGLDSGVVISLGRSMGSALLWGGKPQQGRRGSIMELEHLSLDTYGEADEDSPPGSSNRWLSGEGLRSRIDEADLGCSVKELFADHEDSQLVTEFIDRLAHLLGTVTMTLDPERLVLTGGITKSSEVWRDRVEQRMDDFIMEQFSGIPSVTLGRLRGEQIVKGPAGFWFWKQSESD